PRDARVPRSSARTMREMFQARTAWPAYKKMLAQRQQLPAYGFREQIISEIRDNPVVLLVGDTGCGKTTQVPQFLVEDMLSNPKTQKCQVVCTQPRRISAMSIAQRVSAELADPPGSFGSDRSLVGYQVRLDSRVSASSALIYCTTGILLRRLEGDRALSDITHIVIDEVQERTLESDFLLVAVRRLLARRPDLRVVIMSATVDAQRFAAYFQGCPIISIPGRTFPVDVHYLEDVVELTGNIGAIGLDEEDLELGGDALYPEQFLHGSYSNGTRRTLNRMDENRINYELIIALLEYLCSNTAEGTQDDAILIFLPGMPEIRTLHQMLSANKRFANTKRFLTIPVHSLLAGPSQELAFRRPPPGVRKIILATNIAETGITIPDVTTVIDTGKAKEIRQKRQVTMLEERFVARANARQRRGRAGRVQEGVCFHLFTKHRHDTMMIEYQLPEMLRLPLEELCLRIKVYGYGAVDRFLADALDPPKPAAVETAIRLLKEVGAFNEEEALTPLGEHLAKLPIDVRLAKMLVYATVFRCLDPILTIAAAMSFKSIFVQSYDRQREVDTATNAFRMGDSDMLTRYNAYCAWYVTQTTKKRMIPIEFCRRNYLDQQTLQMVEDTKRQLLGLLISSGLVKADQATARMLMRQVRGGYRSRSMFCPIMPEANEHASQMALVSSIITAGLYPHVARRDRDGSAWLVRGQPVHVHASSVN
ncbi:P-loop containing nucleoside triphosphate hydrolase protein, partial [Thamnocephalis sphaerospora]